LRSNILLAFKRTLYPLYRFIHYQKVIHQNQMRMLFYKRTQNAFLFILGPPFSGTTLLHELLSTSANVSPNNTLGTREGQQLPKIRKVMWEKADHYSLTEAYDWDFIKTEWLKYWDITKPILLEKSPPNLVRAEELKQYFQPAYFIGILRNPYALCESQIRTNNMPPQAAAEYVVGWFYSQRENIQKLNQCLFFTYEELTDNVRATREKIITFLPLLSDIRTDIIFNAHNIKNSRMRISNLNAEKIGKLTNDQLQEINSVFDRHMHLFQFFGYSRIT
jgi:hypothetical protein